jgi:hypothetical protein
VPNRCNSSADSGIYQTPTRPFIPRLWSSVALGVPLATCLVRTGVPALSDARGKVTTSWSVNTTGRLTFTILVAAKTASGRPVVQTVGQTSVPAGRTSFGPLTFAFPPYGNVGWVSIGSIGQQVLCSASNIVNTG